MFNQKITNRFIHILATLSLLTACSSQGVDTETGSEAQSQSSQCYLSDQAGAMLPMANALGQTGTLNVPTGGASIGSVGGGGGAGAVTLNPATTAKIPVSGNLVFAAMVVSTAAVQGLTASPCSDVKAWISSQDATTLSLTQRLALSQLSDGIDAYLLTAVQQGQIAEAGAAASVTEEMNPVADISLASQVSLFLDEIKELIGHIDRLTDKEAQAATKVQKAMRKAGQDSLNVASAEANKISDQLERDNNDCQQYQNVLYPQTLDRCNEVCNEGNAQGWYVFNSLWAAKLSSFITQARGYLDDIKWGNSAVDKLAAAEMEKQLNSYEQSYDYYQKAANDSFQKAETYRRQREDRIYNAKQKGLADVCVGQKVAAFFSNLIR